MFRKPDGTDWSEHEIHEALFFDPDVSDIEEDEDVEQLITAIVDNNRESAEDTISALLGNHEDINEQEPFGNFSIIDHNANVLHESQVQQEPTQSTGKSRNRTQRANKFNANSSEPKKRKMPEKVSWKWSDNEFEPPVDLEWKSSLPPPSDDKKSPLDYFKYFFDQEIISHIVSESNKYALQKDGTILRATDDEIEQYIGILIHMGVVKMPQLPLYWSKECRYSPVADVMSRNRFESIKKFFHLNDNMHMKKKGEPGHDKLYKVRPLLDLLTKKFNDIPPEEKQSIDEQVIPFKGRSFLKQYNKNKPHKWGFKIITRCSTSGIMHDFRIYVGEGTCGEFGLGFSGDIVMELTKILPDGKNFKVFYDNWFSSLSLALALRARSIWTVGTIRSDRMGKCPLEPEESLKKKGRGSMDEKVSEDGTIALVRWYDTKAINLVSTYCGKNPTDTCERFCKKQKCKVNVTRPAIVTEYNQFMGGVDLVDMLIELYRIDIKSQKWYTRIISWFINISVVNSWLLYRRDIRLRGEKVTELSLLQFCTQIAWGLTTSGKSNTKKRGRPSSQTVKEVSTKKFKVCPPPTNEIRFDNVSHFGEYAPKKNKCRACHSTTQMKCRKCNVFLCLTAKKNCFLTYHTKN